ncbi:GIY-YIG nuclease family protein [Agrobacterium sp.]|uniref:GIY-YIG nuclease family protein n=1 Tax=Agrobacterium sp. TaxID=361 RepID=UPI00289DE4CB|nr:GIY-YIG nuclease family protein [Agrobacterium sp.]
MADRPSFEEVVSGLETKSDMIRALARAGYIRTEIASLLGIRYQHVRKVLVDAGITEGFKPREEVSLEREPVVVEVGHDDSADRSSDTSWEVLLRAGFHFLGEWRGENEDFQIDAKAPIDAGVYSFIVDDVVKYVGLTQRGLRARLDGYRRGYERQRTNARVKALIQEALAAGKRVKVLVAVPHASEWNGLPVNTAAGLEAGLIAKIQPAWNILGVSAA